MENTPVFIILPSMHGNGGFCGHTIMAETTLGEALSKTPFDFGSEVWDGPEEFCASLRICWDDNLNNVLYVEEVGENAWRAHEDGMKQYDAIISTAVMEEVGPVVTRKKPRVTFTGIDAKTDTANLPVECEIGILYTATPEGRNRYPSRDQIHAIIDSLSGQDVAIHVCGSAARLELIEGALDDLITRVSRVQVNGKVNLEEVKMFCNRYPDTVFITQHNEVNAHLVVSEIENHALLVDASGGRGISPDVWVKPRTSRPVGFAGGIGPDNICEVLEAVMPIARQDFWLDMEGKLRDEEDWFDTDAVNAVHAQYNSSFTAAEWPTRKEDALKDAEVLKDRTKIDHAANAVKAKFEEAVRDKNRCCWEQLETDELIAMLRGHIDKFEERGSSSRRDAADLIGISMMVFHKCSEGDFKYLSKGGKDA